MSVGLSFAGVRRRGHRQPGDELGARLSSRAGGRAPRPLRSPARDGGCPGCRRTRSHCLHHGIGAPPGDRWRRGRPRVERLQPGRAPWARCGRGRQHQPAPQSRGFQWHGGHGGRCGVPPERRRPALCRVRAWPSSSPFSFPLSLCWARIEGSWGGCVSRRVGQRGSPPPSSRRRANSKRPSTPDEERPEMPGRPSLRWSSSSWPAWPWRRGRPRWADTSAFPRSSSADSSWPRSPAFPTRSLPSIWPGGAVARPR